MGVKRKLTGVSRFAAGVNGRMFVCFILLLSFVIPTSAEVSRRVFRNYTSANGLADNSAQTIHCTKTGRLVITTVGQINFYDGSKFSYIDPLDENVYALPEYRGNYHLYFDKFHHIWLKSSHSVTCVDLITERFVASIDEEFRKFGVKERVNDLFVDSAGVVWLLVEKGLYNVKTKLTIKPKRQLNLQDLEIYKGQYVMLFYNNGLMEMYDQISGKKIAETKAYGTDDEERYGNTSVLKLDGDKVYQIRNGQKEAVFMSYDIGKNEWAEILRTPYHLNNIAVRDSLLYLPCEYGYWVVNTISNDSRHIETVQLENNKELSTDINVIAFDRQGGMWAGTEKRGLLYSRPFKAPFSVYPWGDSRADHYGAMMDDVDQQPKFRERTVNCVYKDSRGWTWVGTSQGLQVYRKESDVLPQVFTKKDGLYNNIVHSIVEDNMHDLWVATSYGISVVMFSENRVHRIISYNEYDNIPNEGFVNGKAMRMPDGKIVMQGLDHVVEFDPATMSTLNKKFAFQIFPKLVKLMVNGVDVNTTTEIDGKRVVDRALSRIWGVDLNYNMNSITMTFSALNYFRPQQTYYRVRIIGLDDEWQMFTPYNSGGMVDNKGMLHLPLMALRPGHYEIEVQASMSTDDWETKPYVWTIDIHEPWWRTTGVFLGFAMVLVALLLINIFFYMKNANLKALRNSEEKMLIRRIYSFVERCEAKGELLEATPEEYTTSALEPQNALDPAFITALEKIKPLVLQNKQRKMTMRKLSAAAGISGKEFYELLTSNIFKSPRALIKKARLEDAEKMLRVSKEPIDVIAKKCGFASTNYFIASFYHKYKVTPLMFRQKR